MEPFEPPVVPADTWLVRDAAKAGAAAIGYHKPRWSTKKGQRLLTAAWNLLNRRTDFPGAETLDPHFVKAVVALQPKESGFCPSCLRRKPLDWLGRLQSHGTPPGRRASPDEKRRGESYNACQGYNHTPLAECSGDGSPGYHELDWSGAWIPATWEETHEIKLPCKHCHAEASARVSFRSDDVRWNYESPRRGR